MSLPPRVLIVMRDQWERALLRAALREVGYDAVGAPDARDAARRAGVEAERGPVRLIVADHDAAAQGADDLRGLCAALHDPPALLIARGTRAAPPGAWSQIVRRPAALADVVAAVRSLLPLSAGASHPLDAGREPAEDS